MRRVPPDVRANVGLLELKARIYLAEDIHGEAEGLSEARAKKHRQIADAILSAASFKAFLVLAQLLTDQAGNAQSDTEREAYRSQLEALVSVQPIYILAVNGEDIPPVLEEIVNEPRQRKRWWQFWRN
jgi:hypothetical protein